MILSITLSTIKIRIMAKNLCIERDRSGKEIYRRYLYLLVSL